MKFVRLLGPVLLAGTVSAMNGTALREQLGAMHKNHADMHEKVLVLIEAQKAVQKLHEAMVSRLEALDEKIAVLSKGVTPEGYEDLKKSVAAIQGYINELEAYAKSLQ